MSDSNWLSEFPEMDRSDLRAIRKTLDGAYRDFSREYGDHRDLHSPSRRQRQMCIRDSSYTIYETSKSYSAPCTFLATSCGTHAFQICG